MIQTIHRILSCLLLRMTMTMRGDGIVRGRQLFHAGRLHAAEQCWRECLKEAYAQGNHAATFVLSKNLGDVTADHAEALQFYEYALELATTCGVLREPSLRPVIAMIAVAIQDLDSNRHACQACQAPDQRIFRQPTAQETHLCFRCYEQQVNTDKTIYTCATCGNGFSLQELTRDTDDEVYCKPCYDAYYDGQDDDISEDENEEKEEAADPGMLCAMCLDADGTVRDLNELFYCQPCFIRKNQPPVDFVADVVEPDELPTTTTVEANEVTSTTTAELQTPSVIPSRRSSKGSKRLVYSRAALMSLRYVLTECPSPVKKSSVYAAPTPSKAEDTASTLETQLPSPTMTKEQFSRHVVSTHASNFATMATYFQKQRLTAVSN
ncbi:hypothetical protein AC1031_021528 [Aphanomyces cochlioides]|nr:hypothetical protein AC1031_021528 [Aphanomyces cochlioides]